MFDSALIYLCEKKQIIRKEKKEEKKTIYLRIIHWLFII